MHTFAAKARNSPLPAALVSKSHCTGAAGREKLPIDTQAN